MIVWTHIFDLIGKILSFAVMLCVFWVLMESGWKGKEHVFLFMTVGSFSLLLVWSLVFRPLSSMVYARVRLSARLSWAQANAASILFSPWIPVPTWHTALHVLDLPVNERAAAIMMKAEEVRAKQTAEWRQWKASGWTRKTHTALEIIAVILCVILTFAHLPPASWISDLQARFLADGSYSPVLTILLCAAPVGLLFRLMRPRGDVRTLSVVNDEHANTESPKGIAQNMLNIEPAQPDSRTEAERYGPPGQQ